MQVTQLRTDNLVHARKIARSLGKTENDIDISILAQTELLTSIVDGRMQVGAPPQVGHTAFKKAVAALNAMAEARELVIDCHTELADVRDHFRLPARSVGCTPDKGLKPAQGQAA